MTVAFLQSLSLTSTGRWTQSMRLFVYVCSHLFLRLNLTHHVLCRQIKAGVKKLAQALRSSGKKSTASDESVIVGAPGVKVTCSRESCRSRLFYFMDMLVTCGHRVPYYPASLLADMKNHILHFG